MQYVICNIYLKKIYIYIYTYICAYGAVCPLPSGALMKRQAIEQCESIWIHDGPSWFYKSDPYSPWDPLLDPIDWFQAMPQISKTKSSSPLSFRI